MQFSIFDWIVVGSYLVGLAAYIASQWMIRDVFKRIGSGEIVVVPGEK